MASLFICINCTQFKLNISESEKQQRGKTFTLHAAKSGGFSLKSITSKCQTCRGEGAIECSGCKGTGKNKKNGNIFERWKCFECQGFGFKSCPVCGKGGLTPEQRGER
ncbi:protein PHOTOSYSTEM I ASSEMBLY 2, chloroplastic isoform X1 [Olea europaea var. sylvestris]|uniref:protein PHOTOSYSTEM I ASSEMBLY 2, chloroplastic isoform X1 n=1 Tax=Olea europaea var. sylvestris TaxID=158386 RepID=UPI000C1D698C|nr:protein PHOTOSYSTEM I ASSEMBLY 2, chloroplastic isoform X1 [Olea europaea var. sylvestris]